MRTPAPQQDSTKKSFQMRSRRRRRATTLAALGLTVVWATAATSGGILVLLLAVATVAALVVWVRRSSMARPVLLTALAALALGGAALWAMSTPTVGGQQLAAALTGCLILVPTPLLVAAWGKRVLNPGTVTVAGLAALLVTAAAAAALGTGWVTTALLAEVVAGLSVWCWARRRATAQTIQTLPVTDFDWYEVTTGDVQILYHGGHLIVAGTARVCRPGVRAQNRIRLSAAGIADEMGLPLSRVRPVLLHPDGNLTRIGEVTIAHPDNLAAVAAHAPRGRTRRRDLIRLDRLRHQDAEPTSTRPAPTKWPEHTPAEAAAAREDLAHV